MNAILSPFVSHFELSGHLETDVHRFLVLNNCPATAEHSLRVGYEAKKIAQKNGIDSAAAEAAGFLHDISAVFANHQRVQAAKDLGLEVLPEEEVFPQIVHQKISGVMAKEIFNVMDERVISAVSCHTTLKPGASVFDRVVFVADKIEWDQPGNPSYIKNLEQQLSISLEHGALAYLSYLWEHKDALKVLHPWAEAAYHELYDRLNDKKH